MAALAKAKQPWRVTDSVSLAVDAPPPLNNCFFNVAGRGRIKSAAYREWSDRAAWQVQAQRPGRIVGPYEVTIKIRRASLRRDLDGFLKQTLDLLVSCGVTDDDRHLTRLSAEWMQEGEGMLLEVRAAP